MVLSSKRVGTARVGAGAAGSAGEGGRCAGRDQRRHNSGRGAAGPVRAAGGGRTAAKRWAGSVKPGMPALRASPKMRAAIAL
eukprot:scaffold2431_cov116-Isochrysis_galbana.AAC.6